ncbi:MAG: matrixin family metalloprotease [Deltaproteobacteria bacterium]|nr:matrixin family metalloprotease [Deltaproteobacteria bacterium]
MEPINRQRSIFSLLIASVVGLTGACSAEGIESEDDLSQAAEDEDSDMATDPDVEPADDPTPLDHDESEEEVFGVAVGDMVEVEDGVLLPVPEPGSMLAIDIMYEDGGTTSATLAHDTDGRVRIIHPDDHLLGLPEGTAAACAGKCQDQSFSYVFGNNTPAKWKSRLNWRYRHANSPVGKTAAINAFKNGAVAVPKSRNSCNMADQVSATQSYKGETNVVPSVGVSSGTIFCKAAQSQDGINVIGWGPLPGSTLAVTCTRAIGDGAVARITDMDMRYDKAVKWYTGNNPPASCTDRFSLRGVATHEFGHAYGLGHTSQCNLVMAPATGDCTSVNRVFGRGDVKGLRSLY